MPKTISGKKETKKIIIPLWVVTSIAFLLIGILGFLFNQTRVLQNCIFFHCFFRFFAARLDTKFTFKYKK